MADIAESLTIFDAYGRVRVDFEAELAGLSPDRLERLEAVFNAAVAERAAEQEQTDAMAHVAARTRAVADAEQALRAASPQLSFIDIHRQAVRAHSMLPLDPAEIKEEKKKAAELAKRLKPLEEAAMAAQSELDAARKRVSAASADLKIKRSEIAREILQWQALHPVVTHESLVQEAAARSQERLLGLATGALSSPIKPKPASRLDALMMDGGRGKSTRRLPSQR